MFEGFRAEYSRIKKGSTKPSRLAPLFQAIQAYEAEQTKARLQNIEKVMDQVMMIKKLGLKIGVKNVVRKYDSAFSILRTEIMEQHQYLDRKPVERGELKRAPRARVRPEPPKRKAPKLSPPPRARVRPVPPKRKAPLFSPAPPPPPPAPPPPPIVGKEHKSFKLEQIPSPFCDYVIDEPKAKNIVGKLMKEIEKISPDKITGKCVIDGIKGAVDPVIFTTIAWAFERTGNMQIQPAGEADYSSVKKNGRIYISGHGEKGGYASGYKTPAEYKRPDDKPSKGSLLYQICQAMTHPETGIPIASDPVYIIYTRCHAGDLLKGDSYVKQLSKALSEHKKRPDIYVIGCKTNTIKAPITGNIIYTRLSTEKHNQCERIFEKYFVKIEGLKEEYKGSGELKEEPQLIELALYTTIRTMARTMMKNDLRVRKGAYGYNIDHYQIYHKGREIQLSDQKERVLETALNSPLVFELTPEIFKLM